MNFIKKNKILFYLIIIIGFYLRLKASLNLSYWLDEALVFKTSQLSIVDLLLMKHWDQAHPQLYYLFMHFWQQIGSTEIFLRSPSLFLYFPSIYFVYKINQLTYNNKSGVLSSLIFAIHPFLVSMGYQAKIYSFVIFFTLGSLWSLINTFKSNQIKWHVLFILFSILAFYSDYSAVWYLGSLFITTIFLIKKYNKVKNILIDLSIIALFTLFQMPIFFSGLEQALKLESFLDHPKILHIINLIHNLSGLGNFNVFSITTILFILILIIMINFQIKEKNNLKYFFITCLLLFTIFTISTSFMISQHSQIFVPRNMWVAILIIVFGLPIIINFNKNQKSEIKKYIINILNILIISFYSIILFQNSNNFQKFDGSTSENWKALKKEITISTGSKSIIIIGEKNWGLNPLKDYYLPGYPDNVKLDIPIIQFKLSNIYPNIKTNKEKTLGENLWIFIDWDILENLSEKDLNQIKNNFNCQYKNCSKIHSSG